MEKEHRNDEFPLRWFVHFGHFITSLFRLVRIDFAGKINHDSQYHLRFHLVLSSPVYSCANMYPISCTSPRLLSICLAILVLLAVNVVGSPIGSPVLALASPSVTLTSVHPLASNSPWNLHAVVTPTETVKDEIYFWMDGDNAELYIGSRRFGLSNGHERLEPKEVGIPQIGTRKIGQVIYPSTNVKEQVLQILGKCGIRITTSIKANPVRICRGHYFQNIIQKLVKVSEMNSLEVKDENGGGDLDSLFTNLLRDTGFLGTSKKTVEKSYRFRPY